jgi:hypothetical protein
VFDLFKAMPGPSTTEAEDENAEDIARPGETFPGAIPFPMGRWAAPPGLGGLSVRARIARFNLRRERERTNDEYLK